MTLIVQGAILQGVFSAEPSFTIWSRLEPLPTNADLRPGLQARIADPLWLLGRQWQFGELQAEDAGSPIEVRVAGQAVALGRYAPGVLSTQSESRAQDCAASPLPLEVLVEREPVRATHARLAVEAGLQFLRYLVDEGVTQHRARFLTSPAYALDEIAVANPSANPDGDAWATLLSGRATLDGRKLAAAFRPLADENYVLAALPAEPVIPARSAAVVRRAAGRWLRWYDESISEPNAQPESWNPSRQEYAFALSAEVAEGPVVIAADEYRDGRVDWYSFRAASAPSLGSPTSAVAPTEVIVPPMLPVPVRYPGMPADRYWEFEDARVNLAELRAGRTDLVQMLLVEFALAYGNDWFVIPLPLPVGSLFRMRSCSVRDTFGVESPIGRSRDNTGVPWTMFELSTAPGEPAYLSELFFLAPTVPLPLGGDPVEQVALFRDEMANLCWGVERRVQGPFGETVDRYREASRTAVHQRLVDPPSDARLIYRLASPVPEHWIPFVPVPATVNGDPAGVQLERRVLLRFDATGVSRAVHPHGLLLRSDLSMPADGEPPLRLEEEEVPREGAVVERAFHYARGARGESYLWLGREKRVGTGEGASLLRFDIADSIGAG
jgi:hypothetical protein